MTHRNTIKNKTKTPGISNPYAIAVLTVVLAAISSVIGAYYKASFEAQQTITQKKFEFRVQAYTTFLDKTNHLKTPDIFQILTIGAIADHLATDGEIQEFEDRIAELLNKHTTQDIYQQLTIDLNPLRLHGTTELAEICDDLLKTLLLSDHEIDWSKYSPNVISMHDRWRITHEKGEEYGVIERVSSDDRLMIVMISVLFQAIITQLRKEIHAPTT